MTIINHQIADNVFIKTELSGAFRWLESSKTWQQIIHFLNYPQNELFGIAEIVFHPTNPKIMYVACGKKMPQTNHALYKSIDGGYSFQQILTGCRCSAETEHSNTGPRLAISPYDPNIILFGELALGSLSGNIHRSINGGTNWTKVNRNHDIFNVTFSKYQANVVFYNRYGGGLNRSTNNGLNWSSIGGPKRVRKLVSTNNAIWMTHFRYTPLETIPSTTPAQTFDGFIRYNGSTWVNRAPVPGSYGALAINPNNQQEMLIYSVDTKTIYHTLNEGLNWREVVGNNNPPRCIFEALWQKDNINFREGIGSIDFDPFYPNRVWVNNSTGVYRTDNILDTSPLWVQLNNGISQGRVNSLTFPSNHLLSGFKEISGFFHETDTQTPTEKLGKTRGVVYATIRDLAHCFEQPNTVYRSGIDPDGYEWVSRSSDGGKTWFEYNWDNPPLIRLAVSKNDPNFVVAVSPRRSPYFSINDITIDSEGNNFTYIVNTFNQLQNFPVGPDVVNLPTSRPIVGAIDSFFYYDGFNELPTFGNVYRIYKTNPTTVTYQQISQLPQSSVCDLQISANNTLWIGLGTQGLWKSDSNGVSWTQILPGIITNVITIACGMAYPGSSHPTIYLFGLISGTWGLYASINNGVDWIRLKNIPGTVNNLPSNLIASPINSGEVFIGTQGSGILKAFV